MTKRKVYVVTQGDYSDYKIIAIYSSRLLAEAHIERQNRFKAAEGVECYSDDLELEVWELNTFNPFGKQWYAVTLKKNGDLYKCVANGFKDTDVSSTKIGYTFIWEGLEAKELGIRVTLLAKTLEQAIKAANEWRIREIALNQWGIQVFNQWGKDNPHKLWMIHRGSPYEIVSGRDFEQGSRVRFTHNSVGTVVGRITYVSCAIKPQRLSNSLCDYFYVKEDE
jgi:hypothetical protein